MEVVQPKDLGQYSGLAKKRVGELCRQKRIFNARNRIIGVRSLVPLGKGARRKCGGAGGGRDGAVGEKR